MTDRQIFIIAGAGGTAYGPDEIQDLSKRFERTAETTKITLIGDGISPIDINWLNDKINLLSTDIPTTFVIQSHGKIDNKNNQHVLCLDGKFVAGGYVYEGESTNTASLFQIITDKFKTQAVDIFMTSCHGAGALRDIDALPTGSAISVLSPEDEVSYGGDVKKWFKSRKSISDTTAKGLLNSFLQNGLETKSDPNYAVSGTGFLNIASKLSAKRGKSFSPSEISKIHQALDNEIGHERVSDVVDAIKEDSVPALKYGDALSAIMVIKNNFDDQIKNGNNSDLSSDCTRIKKTFSSFSTRSPRSSQKIYVPSIAPKKRLFSPFD